MIWTLVIRRCHITDCLQNFRYGASGADPQRPTGGPSDHIHVQTERAARRGECEARQEYGMTRYAIVSVAQMFKHLNSTSPGF